MQKCDISWPGWARMGTHGEGLSSGKNTLDYRGLLTAGVLARAVWAWVSMGSWSSEGILGLVAKHLLLSREIEAQRGKGLAQGHIG